MTMTPNTHTQLNESYKVLYADRLKYLLPENFRYVRDVGTKKGRLGRQYNFPLVLKQEQGFTYAKYNAGEVTFNDTVPGIIKEATAYGYQLFGWCGIDFETAAKGANSKTAFVDSVGHIIESLYTSAQRRMEISGWYGQAGLARVSAVNTTSDYVDITAATWAPSMWIGAEGAWIKFSDHTTTDYSATITNTVIYGCTSNGIHLGATVSGSAGAGSNAWAIAPPRSATGHALLLAQRGYRLLGVYALVDPRRTRPSA